MRTAGVMRLYALGLAAALLGCGGPDEQPRKPPLPLAAADYDAPGCDPTISVHGNGPALLVRDPDILSAFSLERVLQQIVHIAAAELASSPLEVMQRIFDVYNASTDAVFDDAAHCDDLPACPRAEGELARSDFLLEPGHPDSFVPLALVNRFDLTPADLSTCGEYRIVFGKLSGRTNHAERVLLILEAALPNPHTGLWSCQPIAQAWASLQDQSDPAAMTAILETIYFDGVPGFRPVVHPEHYGMLTNPASMYGVTQGQVRIGLGMQAPFSFRELRLIVDDGDAGPSVAIEPARVKSNPLSSLFDDTAAPEIAKAFRAEFSSMTIETLWVSEAPRIRMPIRNVFNDRESSLEGAAAPNYAGIVQDPELVQALAKRIEKAGLDAKCPPGDPLTPVDVLRRASLQTCAGCHAPERMLDQDLRVGCGLVWPQTVHNSHIDEHGHISAALTDVFLPHRARVLETYLQSCDAAAAWANLQPVLGP